MSTFDRIELVEKSNGEEIRANPHLQCPFYLDLWYQPIQCSICKKCYCKDCFDTWTGEKKCFGGKDIHTFSRNIPTQNWIIQYLDKFKIKCCYQGCPQKQMKYKNFKNHTRYEHIKKMVIVMKLLLVKLLNGKNFKFLWYLYLVPHSKYLLL